MLPTLPEKLVHEALRRRGVEFFTEHVIGRFCVDVLLPLQKTVIFIDGCYWHACPTHFPERKAHGRDKARIPYLLKCGYRTIILWEHAIKENVDAVLEELL